MTEEKMQAAAREPEKKRSAPGTGEQYLAALFQCADWIPVTYKELAVKNRANTEYLKELYLCACDGVPVEKAAEAQTKKPPEGALRFLRRKHVQEIATAEYRGELAEIRVTAAALEKEVLRMSETVDTIASHMQDMDGLFPDQGQSWTMEREPEKISQQENNKPKPGEGSQDRAGQQAEQQLKREKAAPVRKGKATAEPGIKKEQIDSAVGDRPGSKRLAGNDPGSERPVGSNPGSKRPAGDDPGSKRPAGNDPGSHRPVGSEPEGSIPRKLPAESSIEESIDGWMEKLRKCFPGWKEKEKERGQQEEHMTDYVERLLKEGYDTDQLDFLLDCMEEGLTAKEIQRFASPKLPVKVMRRLKMIGEKERSEKHG